MALSVTLVADEYRTTLIRRPGTHHAKHVLLLLIGLLVLLRLLVLLLLGLLLLSLIDPLVGARIFNGNNLTLAIIPTNVGTSQ